MKCPLLIPIIFLFYFIPASGQIISQYIETSSGSTPKGIEIWNNTSTDLNFASNNLVIEKGTNGAAPSADFTINSGTLQPWKVLVIGTSDLQSITESNSSMFLLKAFTFNGDDALVIKYGGMITDVFGITGTDPGTAWSGNGVSTANQNIALLEGVETGDTDGWIDPSQRFETISTDNSAVSFGVAPIHITGTLLIDPLVLNGFSYLFQQGPSLSQQFTLSGTDLYNNVEITPSSSYEISTDNILFQSSIITLPESSGKLPLTTVYVRLKEGLEVGRYNNEPISIASVGAIGKTVICNGRVNYTAEMPLPNAWINEFHYDNEGTDVDEFVEVVIEKATLFDRADFSVSLYNGGDGKVYDSETVNNFTFGSTNKEFSLYTWFPASLQNGPDGFSINYKDEAILLLSYEGSFTATDGSATGMVSSDIGIEQSSTKTLIGYSLQLASSGNRYAHFQWFDLKASPGIINIHQNFGEPIPAVPLDYRIIILFFFLVALKIVFKRL
jgi:hypothetical protein